MRNVKIALVGATGMVGRTFIKVLEESNISIEKLYLFASKNSAGKTVDFRQQQYVVEELTENSFDYEIDICLFSAGGDVSKKYAPIAASKGSVVIDNSSAWRMDPNVPLIVPEVNPQDILWHKGIISNPNCSTIQAVAALYPLHKKYQIKRIVYSTYQAVSGSGYKGVKDLEEGIQGRPCSFYPYPIAFNCLPHIDIFEENGYTKEEMKMINESKKILKDNNIKITATAVRVPVKNGHSEAINVEFYNPYDLGEVRKILSNSPGLKVIDDPTNNIYPTVLNCNGKDEVLVGRIRRDFSVENGLNFWIVADNVRKGAATNAVQIAKLLLD